MDECTQLQDRIAKIEAFIDTPPYNELPDGDQTLLLSQSFVMAHYFLILQERIDRLS